MIIPEREETIVRIYYCPKCETYYCGQVGNTRISCAVNHPPGSCCHYAEKSISLEKVKKIKEIMEVSK